MSSLVRYGIQWNGPHRPICTVMADGYWTPWHEANANIAALQAENDALRAEFEGQEPFTTEKVRVGWKIVNVPLYAHPIPPPDVREPTDAELLAFATEEQLFLFCDKDEFLQIARAVLQFTKHRRQS